MATKIPAEAPCPRNCHVKKAYPEQEYGFNLHAERGKGQFIGKVDPGSPADLAGLLSGDRIYAVNGFSIIEESHKQAVSRIKEDPLQCRLLVIDEPGEQWYREHKITITPSLANIIELPFVAVSSKEKEEEQQNHSEENVTDENDANHINENGVNHHQTGVTQQYDDTPMDNGNVHLLPRLATLVKKLNSDEYGFNLHADKGKGHFIGKVDHGSIAQIAGLEEGQRIVGVNGTLIYPDSPHKDVVSLIKQSNMGGQLLVAGPEIDAWYRTRDISYSFQNAEEVTVPIVITHIAPTNGNVSHGDDSVSMSSQNSHEKAQNDVTVISVTNGNTNEIEHQREESIHSEQSSEEHSIVNSDIVNEYENNSSKHESPPPIKKFEEIKPSSPVTNNGNGNGHREFKHPEQPSNGNSNAVPLSPEVKDMFSMSAAEMRQALAARKKRDPKKENLTLQEKYNIIRNL